MSVDILNKVKEELQQLEGEFVEIDGKQLRPSQCYRFETDPAHVLFNTNCPESLKQKVQAILLKYIPHHESHTAQPENK